MEIKVAAMRQIKEKVMNDGAIILAIDDDPVVLSAIVSALKESYRVRPVTSGEKALEFLRTRHVDLILVDHQMPYMTGFEVLEILQADPHTCDIPVVLLTSSVDDEIERRALEMGAIDYMQKPVRPLTLLTRIGILLELQMYRTRFGRLPLYMEDEEVLV